MQDKLISSRYSMIPTVTFSLRCPSPSECLEIIQKHSTTPFSMERAYDGSWLHLVFRRQKPRASETITLIIIPGSKQRRIKPNKYVEVKDMSGLGPLADGIFLFPIKKLIKLLML